MSALYVYALVDRPSRPLTIGGRRIEVVPAGRVFAVVERLARPRAFSERTLLQQHALVVALARRFDPILPVRFGTFLEQPSLDEALSGRGRIIRSAFHRVKNRRQLTVRLFGPAAATEGAPSRPSTGAAYLKARRRAARADLPPAARRIRRAVRPIVDGERIDPGRGAIRVTLHHLVPAARVAEYRAAVRRSLDAARRPEQAVVSGPWPPFAFTPELS